MKLETPIRFFMNTKLVINKITVSALTDSKIYKYYRVFAFN